MPETLQDVAYVDVAIHKTKIGPITERYVSGEKWVDVDPHPDDGTDKYALVGMDNSHSSDYSVAHASDPLVVIAGGPGRTHAELKAVLQHNGLWSDHYRPIAIPHGSDKWIRAFKTTPDHARYDLRRKVLKEHTDREMDFREGEHSAHGFIPKPV